MAQKGLPSSRIEALSDGVFAIAMTLLVLELRVPEVDGADSAALVTALGAMWPKFVGFALGFVLLGTVWLGHHYQFHYIRRVDRPLLWLNLALLLVCSAVPFAVALLGRYWARPVATSIYGALLLCSGVCLLAHWSYATSNRRLVDASLDEAIVHALRARIVLGLTGYGLGFALSFVWPPGSIVTYALMPIVYFPRPYRPARGFSQALTALQNRLQERELFSIRSTHGCCHQRSDHL